MNTCKVQMNIQVKSMMQKYGFNHLKKFCTFSGSQWWDIPRVDWRLFWKTFGPSTWLLPQRFSRESGQIMAGWWRIRVSEAEGKGWSVIVGQWEYKYPEQEGATAMCHSPSSPCFCASPPLKIYGWPWRETEECATAHSRARSTLTASNAPPKKQKTTPWWRLPVLLIPDWPVSPPFVRSHFSIC